MFIHNPLKVAYPKATQENERIKELWTRLKCLLDFCFHFSVFKVDTLQGHLEARETLVDKQENVLKTSGMCRCNMRSLLHFLVYVRVAILFLLHVADTSNFKGWSKPVYFLLSVNRTLERKWGTIQGKEKLFWPRPPYYISTFALPTERQGPTKARSGPPIRDYSSNRLVQSLTLPSARP